MEFGAVFIGIIPTPGEYAGQGGEDMPDRAIVVNGYAYPSIDLELLAETAPNLTFVSAFSYGITEDGHLISLEDAPIVQTAGRFGAKSLMVFTALTQDGSFNSDLAGRVFEDPKIQDRLIEEMLANIKEKGMYGVDFDFEFIYPQYKEAYAAFIEKTRVRFNAEGYVVLAALAPKTSGEQKGLLYEGHDYALVGEAANLVLLMTYEWGYTYGPPMAVAPINQVRRVLDYGVTQIEPARILMGIPNYGYDWTLPFVQGESKARLIGNEEALWLADYYGAGIQFDELAQSPFFYYWDAEGRQHEVWFEDERSIRAKLSLVDEYGLAGVSYWNLMRPFRVNWEVLREMFYVVKL